MATDTVKRPPTHLRSPRGREALASHPPAPVDATTSGSLQQRAQYTSTSATPFAPDTTHARKTTTLARSKPETDRRRHAAATQPTLAPLHALPDQYATADELAATSPDADPDATGPHSQITRGLPRGACAPWPVRPTSVELYDAPRAHNPTRRQRSIATVLINEPFFAELVNASTERAFTWRQLARAAQRQGSCRHCRSATSTPSRHRLHARRTHGNLDASRTRSRHDEAE